MAKTLNKTNNSAKKRTVTSSPAKNYLERGQLQQFIELYKPK